MEARHPAGYDPESFRRASADTIRIPRRPPKSDNPSVSQGPPQSNYNSTYGAKSSASTPRQPLGRSSRDRMASPSYASLVRYPGIDDSIHRLTHLAQDFGEGHKPSGAFLDTVETLSTRFIEHVAAERGALQKKALTKPSLLSRNEVIPGRESNSSKRRRVHVQESSDSEDSAPRKRIKSSRPRRNVRQVRYSDQDDQADIDHTLPEQRSILPRRSKENMSSMHEDILAAKTLPPIGRVIDVESEHRSNNSEKPPVAVDANTDDDTSGSESEDSWIMPVVRPLPYVRDRPLVSDRTSLTPFNMDDDIDTEDEERKIVAQKQRMALEARQRRAMELTVRARSLNQPMSPGTASPFQSSRPHGVQLCADSVIIPIRGNNIPAGSRSNRTQCYEIISIPLSTVVLRDPPKLYNRNSPEVSIPWKDDTRSFDGLRQPLQGQDALQRPSAQKSCEPQALMCNQENLLIDQTWNEISRQRGPGSAVRILPRVGHATADAQPHFGNPSQQMTQPVAATAPTSSNNVALVSRHQGNVPTNLERDMASAYRSLLQQPAMHGAGSLHRRNGTLESNPARGAAVQNGTSYPNVNLSENHHSRRLPSTVNANAMPQGVTPGLHPVSYQNGSDRRMVRCRPSGSINSSLATMDTPQLSGKPIGPHSHRSTPSTMDLNMHRSLPSPVTPVQVQGLSGATLSGLPGNQMLTQHNGLGSIAGQSELRAMHLNGMSRTMLGAGRQAMGNAVPYAGGLVGYQGQGTAYTEEPRRHVPLPTPVNGTATGGGGRGLHQGQMNSLAATQHLRMSQNHLANLSGQHSMPHQLIQSAALHESSHGLSANIYQAVYEETYRRMFAERQRQIAEQRRRAGGN